MYYTNGLHSPPGNAALVFVMGQKSTLICCIELVMCKGGGQMIFLEEADVAHLRTAYILSTSIFHWKSASPLLQLL
jgi:hypothetical protein